MGKCIVFLYILIDSIDFILPKGFVPRKIALACTLSKHILMHVNSIVLRMKIMSATELIWPNNLTRFNNSAFIISFFIIYLVLVSHGFYVHLRFEYSIRMVTRSKSPAFFCHPLNLRQKMQIYCNIFWKHFIQPLQQTQSIMYMNQEPVCSISVFVR